MLDKTNISVVALLEMKIVRDMARIAGIDGISANFGWKT